MTVKKFATAAVGAAVALLIADAALAQAAPPKPAATTGAAVPPLSATPPAGSAPQIKLGPAIPGVCTYSRQVAFGGSMVGKAVIARLQQLQGQVDSELKTEETAINTEQAAIRTAANTPGADALALQQRQDLLQARYNAYQRKSQVRDREMQMTEQKAVARVLTEAQPFAIAAFQARNCSILLDADSVMIGNPAMDITGDVVKGLNGKLQTLAFDRERLDQQQPTAPVKK